MHVTSELCKFTIISHFLVIHNISHTATYMYHFLRYSTQGVVFIYLTVWIESVSEFLSKNKLKPVDQGCAS